MSKIYSFRLDDNNPRESKSEEIINARMEKGYSLRQIITEALLVCFDKRSGDAEVLLLLEQIKGMMSELANPQNIDISDEREEPGLSSSFLAAVKKSAKVALRSE